MTTHIRYVGDPVALVTAETEEAVEEAICRVKSCTRSRLAVLDPVKAMRDKDGRLLTLDFTEYRSPQPATTLEAPDETDHFWEETPEEISLYGNRNIGEYSMIAPIPALSNAIHPGATGSASIRLS